ncbi:hypothetical protein J8I87_00705 [Paraburkholderia sp. LEh10]|uniref:hypothetical protein n=1 Tax=Paraburkholderia sp. LEh10 TaxID=2821353 RepID=UPI001AE9E8E2|nr:hypothetical protein [Paraburkholderia sp. LEh10]MBP0588263.1 hypothetical protein [Paraburkholderia sp. LEh10]
MMANASKPAPLAPQAYEVTFPRGKLNLVNTMYLERYVTGKECTHPAFRYTDRLSRASPFDIQLGSKMNHDEILRTLLRDPLRGTPNTISVDENTMRTLNDLLVCFCSRKASVCVVGNVRADDGARALRAIIPRLRVTPNGRPAAPVPVSQPAAKPAQVPVPRTPEAFMERFRGIPGWQICSALTSLTPGKNWRGVSKNDMARAWTIAGRGSAAYQELYSITLDMIDDKLP